MISGLETTLIAATTALLGAELTYLSTNRRDQLHARIEIIAKFENNEEVAL